MLSKNKPPIAFRHTLHQILATFEILALTNSLFAMAVNLYREWGLTKLLKVFCTELMRYYE